MHVPAHSKKRNKVDKFAATVAMQSPRMSILKGISNACSCGRHEAMEAIGLRLRSTCPIIAQQRVDLIRKTCISRVVGWRHRWTMSSQDTYQGPIAGAVHAASAQQSSAPGEPHAEPHAEVYSDPDILSIVYSAQDINTAVRSLGRCIALFLL